MSCSQSGSSVSFKSVWDDILKVGSLQYFTGVTPDGQLIGFMRIMVAILIFAILYGVGALLGNIGFSRNIVIAIAGILSIISAIFIPGAVLAGIGGAYATLFSLLLIGTPVVGGLWVIFQIPSTSRPLIFIKLVILLILLWVLVSIKAFAHSTLKVV